jgi:hypothetical protein
MSGSSYQASLQLRLALECQPTRPVLLQLAGHTWLVRGSADWARALPSQLALLQALAAFLHSLHFPGLLLNLRGL